MFLVVSRYRNWDKLQADEPLGSYVDLTFTSFYLLIQIIFS